MLVHRENLAIALNTAIKFTHAEEQYILGYTRDSVFVAGLKEVLESIKRGEDLDFYD